MPVAVSGNALWLAKHNFKGDHPVFMILENNECVELGPGDGLPVVVVFTFENLRNVNSRIGKDGGFGNALWLAKHNFKGDHHVVMVLE